MGAKIPVYDHLGKKFNSISEMCRYYGVGTRLYYDRINRGYSQKEALEMGIGKRKQKYEIQELAKANNIDVHKLAYGLSKGMSIKTIKDWSDGKLVQDHKGNLFKSVSEMCRYYGINQSTYTYRIRKGYSMQEALEK